jgi:hypothetical protein
MRRYRPLWDLKRFLKLDFMNDEKKALLAENAKRILGIYRAEGSGSFVRHAREGGHPGQGDQNTHFSTTST